RDFRGRAAALPAVPLLLMYALADAMWHPPMSFVLEGVIAGLLTSLLAAGIVLVYRANRIVNFAQAELGALPANLALLLIAARHWNYFLAAGTGLAGAILLGVLVEFLFLRRFFRAPRLIATVATIGIAQILLGITLFLPRWIGKANDFKLPNELSWSFHVGVTNFGGNEILVLIVVPFVLAALVAFFRFSVVGTALRATAESADRAALLGIPVRRLQSVLWAIVGVLAYVTLFLRNGVIGASVSQALDPSVLLAALGAAVIGRMERLPTTVFASVGLGIVSEAVFYRWDNDAARPVVITLIIAVALIAQRTDRGSRLKTAAISTWQSTREIRPIPAELRREPAVIAAQVALATLVLAAVVAVPVFLPENRISQIATMGVYGMIGIGLVMLTGWAGQVSLGQMAVAGVTGAAAGWFCTNFTDPVIGGTVVAMLIGGIVGALVTAAIGMPTLRVRGLTFAVMSLAFALVTSKYLLNAGYSPLQHWLPDWYKNGNQLPRPSVLSIAGHNFVSLETETRFYWMTLVVLGIVVYAARGLRSSRTGRILIGVRENERAAESYSVNARRTLLLAFSISGFVTGVAGALFQIQQQSISVVLFDPAAGLQVFAMVVVGGLGSIGGAVLGAVYVYGAQYWLPPEWGFLSTGAGMLLVLLLMPGGLGAALGDARDGALRWYARRRGIRVPSLLADTRVIEPLPAPAAEAVADAMQRPEIDAFVELHE
ncbi:MAG: branched-chain amino acid transport system permease protein livM, partial [Actinomycetota bacterium]|nr:branched-chain amino acid transport system permease protein livM [Actinomycetota bacterium]